MATITINKLPYRFTATDTIDNDFVFENYENSAITLTLEVITGSFLIGAGFDTLSPTTGQVPVSRDDTIHPKLVITTQGKTRESKLHLSATAVDDVIDISA